MDDPNSISIQEVINSLPFEISPERITNLEQLYHLNYLFFGLSTYHYVYHPSKYKFIKQVSDPFILESFKPSNSQLNYEPVEPVHEQVNSNDPISIQEFDAKYEPNKLFFDSDGTSVHLKAKAHLKPNTNDAFNPPFRISNFFSNGSSSI